METILIEKDIMAPMRDGIQLAANVYRLAGAGPKPVILARTPYDKNNIVHGDDTINLFQLVQAGYVIVIQDTRGRFASEGEFTAMLQERQDGADAIAWAAAQPWSDGTVGTFGGSYLGNTQWMAAIERPEALRTIAPLVTWSDIYEGMLYKGGVHVLHGLIWSAAMSVEEIGRRVKSGRIPLEVSAEMIRAVSDPDTLCNHLPLDDHPQLRQIAPHYFDWLSHPEPEEYWHPCVPAVNRIFHDSSHPSHLVLPIIERA